MLGEHFEYIPCVQELTRERPVRGRERDGGSSEEKVK